MEKMIIESGKIERCVLISVDEYKELLEIKGRYLELKENDKNSKIVEIPINIKERRSKWL